MIILMYLFIVLADCQSILILTTAGMKELMVSACQLYSSVYTQYSHAIAFNGFFGMCVCCKIFPSKTDMKGKTRCMKNNFYDLHSSFGHLFIPICHLCFEVKCSEHVVSTIIFSVSWLQNISMRYWISIRDLHQPLRFKGLFYNQC